MQAMTSKTAVVDAERFQQGHYWSLQQLANAKCCGMTTIYADIKVGALRIEKHGRYTRVEGPVAKSYIPGAHRLVKSKVA